LTPVYTVVTELDGLRANEPPLGEAAAEAVSYLESHLRPFAAVLKVQTSRGNYLYDLAIRSEQIDFAGSPTVPGGPGARSMDDVILRAAAWQLEHFVENARERERDGGCKVVLVSMDGNLRLKARARKIDALSNIARIMSATSTSAGANVTENG
jgi:protein SMG6